VCEPLGTFFSSSFACVDVEEVVFIVDEKGEEFWLDEDLLSCLVIAVVVYESPSIVTVH